METTSYRVLVVDDEQEMREELIELLRDYEFFVDSAQNGEEALQKLREGEFDVAVVDLRMPKMDGLTLIRHIEAEEIDTYVIILTGHGDKEDAVAAIKLQNTVKDWFDKSSLDGETLVKRVKRLSKGLSFEELDRIFADVPKTERDGVH